MLTATVRLCTFDDLMTRLAPELLLGLTLGQVSKPHFRTFLLSRLQLLRLLSHWDVRSLTHATRGIMPKFQLARTAVINAPPGKVFQTIADYGTWTTWSPWLLADPEATVTVSQNSSSVGSTYHWTGTVTGEGELAHRTLQPNQLIEDNLTFIKPFKSLAKTSFQLRPEGQGTHVEWSMDSSLPWFLFWMIPMMKTFIGMDYQRGLNMLKDLIETGSIPSKTNVHGIEPVQSFRMAGVAASTSVDKVGAAMEQSFATAQATFKRLGVPMNGAMISVYTKFNVKAGVFDYISGYVIPKDVQVPANSGLTTWELPACNAFRVEHVGSYRHLGNGWSVANQLARHRKLKQSRAGTYEIYRTTPPETPEEELVTDIYLPLKK